MALEAHRFTKVGLNRIQISSGEEGCTFWMEAEYPVKDCRNCRGRWRTFHGDAPARIGAILLRSVLKAPGCHEFLARQRADQIVAKFVKLPGSGTLIPGLQTAVFGSVFGSRE
jgi:hypothetical protein